MGKQKYNKKRDFVYNEGYIIDQLCCSIIKSTLLHNFCYNFSNIQFYFFTGPWKSKEWLVWAFLFVVPETKQDQNEILLFNWLNSSDSSTSSP